MRVEDLSIKEILILKSIEKESKRASRIAEELRIPPATVYNILYRLHVFGLVERDNEKEWKTTEAGRKILKRVIEVVG